MTTDKKFNLQTRPTIRRIVIGVAVLVAVAAFVFMFGQERVAGWIEGGARTAGVEITQGEPK